jgi:hypothetical protein
LMAIYTAYPVPMVFGTDSRRTTRGRLLSYVLGRRDDRGVWVAVFTIDVKLFLLYITVLLAVGCASQ